MLPFFAGCEDAIALFRHPCARLFALSGAIPVSGCIEEYMLDPQLSVLQVLGKKAFLSSTVVSSVSSSPTDSRLWPFKPIFVKKFQMHKATCLFSWWTKMRIRSSFFFHVFVLIRTWIWSRVRCAHAVVLIKAERL